MSRRWIAVVAGDVRASGNRNSEGVLGGLRIRLEIDGEVFEPGAGIAARLVVENHSGHPVVDPGCMLANTRAGLVPRDEPDGELWMVTATDCSGPSTYEAGFTDSYDDPARFFARTKYGDPLPAGDYLAGLETCGVRLLVAVSVAGS